MGGARCTEVERAGAKVLATEIDLSEKGRGETPPPPLRLPLGRSFARLSRRYAWRSAPPKGRAGGANAKALLTAEKRVSSSDGGRPGPTLRAPNKAAFPHFFRAGPRPVDPIELNGQHRGRESESEGALDRRKSSFGEKKWPNWRRVRERLAPGPKAPDARLLTPDARRPMPNARRSTPDSRSPDA